MLILNLTVAGVAQRKRCKAWRIVRIGRPGCPKLSE